jgi:adenine deaminase
MDKGKLLAVARGDEPADLVLRGGRVVNVFSGEIETAALAIVDGLIAGVGDDYAGREMIDLRGAFVAPGLIDAHVHIESSLCMPGAVCRRRVVPHGVTTVVVDPHEIANVAGMDGLRFMAQSSAGCRWSVVVMASSCVPATHMETSGATPHARPNWRTCWTKAWSTAWPK